MFNISQGFNLKSPQFNFARDYYADIATLKAEAESNFPDHFITNVGGVLYQITKSNSVDPTTGRWRKVQLGSDVDLSGYAKKSEAGKSISLTQTQGKLVSITLTSGSNSRLATVDIAAATENVAGVMSASDKAKLDGIESIPNTEIDALFA